MKQTLNIFLLGMTILMAALAHAEKDTKAEQSDKVVLQSTFVGDKEQPAVSYFIPWQGLGSPDKLYRNIEGRNDKTLQVVDRDVLLRSMTIYNEMKLEQTSQILVNIK